MAEGFTVDGKPDRRIGQRATGEFGLITAMLQRDFKLVSSTQHEGYALYRFARIRMSSSKEQPFPPEFKPQPLPKRVPNAIDLSNLPPSELSDYFEQHPQDAIAVMGESEDKRYGPSTFVTRRHDGYRVGWYSIEHGEQCVMKFPKLSDAVTDYLLFSSGKGRWYGRKGVV